MTDSNMIYLRVSADVSGLGKDVKMVPEQRYYQQRRDGFLVAGELLG